jgi:hypothetical protein
VTSLGQVGYPRIRGADQRGTGPHPGWRGWGRPGGRPRHPIQLADLRGERVALLGDRLGRDSEDAGHPRVTRLGGQIRGERVTIHQILAERVSRLGGRDSGLGRELGDWLTLGEAIGERLTKSGVGDQSETAGNNSVHQNTFHLAGLFAAAP